MSKIDIEALICTAVDPCVVGCLVVGAAVGASVGAFVGACLKKTQLVQTLVV